MQPTLTLLMYCENAAAAATATLTQALEAAAALDASLEVIALDAGSTDDTARQLAELSLAYPNNVRVVSFATSPGEQEALRQGMRAARGAYVLVVEPGDTVFVAEALKLATAAQDHAADIVAGGVTLDTASVTLTSEQRAALTSAFNLPQQSLTGRAIVEAFFVGAPEHAAARDTTPDARSTLPTLAAPGATLAGKLIKAELFKRATTELELTPQATHVSEAVLFVAASMARTAITWPELTIVTHRLAAAPQGLAALAATTSAREAVQACMQYLLATDSWEELSSVWLSFATGAAARTLAVLPTLFGEDASTLTQAANTAVAAWGGVLLAGACGTVATSETAATTQELLGTLETPAEKNLAVAPAAHGCLIASNQLLALACASDLRIAGRRPRVIALAITNEQDKAAAAALAPAFSQRGVTLVCFTSPALITPEEEDATHVALEETAPLARAQALDEALREHNIDTLVVFDTNVHAPLDLLVAACRDVATAYHVAASDGSREHLKRLALCASIATAVSWPEGAPKPCGMGLANHLGARVSSASSLLSQLTLGALSDAEVGLKRDMHALLVAEAAHEDATAAAQAAEVARLTRELAALQEEAASTKQRLEEELDELQTELTTRRSLFRRKQ
jgi:hypothetical protein